MEHKLPTELKERWTTALRSGEYKQGRGFLKTTVGYCCLGVLAEVCKVRWKESPDGVCYIDGGLNSDTWLTGQDALDSEAHAALVQPGRMSTVERELASMNDDGASFTQIADWIDQNL